MFTCPTQEGRDKQFLVKQIKDISAAISKEKQEPQQPPIERQAQWDSAPHWEGRHNPAFDPEEEMVTQPPAFFPDDFEDYGHSYSEE